MISANLLKQIEFIKEIDKIKHIQRRTKLFNSDRNENDYITYIVHQKELLVFVALS